jgi:hypothetical protein
MYVCMYVYAIHTLLQIGDFNLVVRMADQEDMYDVAELKWPPEEEEVSMLCNM